jgi:proline dehydrogenase
MPRPFDPGRLDDTETAFRHEGLPRLIHRALVFTGMSLRPLSSFMQRVVVANVSNPLGRILTHFSARLFMGGETLNQCRRVLQKLARYRSKGILDYLVESDESPTGRDDTCQHILDTLRFASQNEVPYAACKPSGLMDLAVLGKVQAGEDLTPEEEHEFKECRARLERLGDAATHLGVRLFVDAEWVYMTEPVDDLMIALMRRFNRERPVIYTTLQMYLQESPAKLHRWLELSQEEGWIFACKLVRGAYLEHERETNPIDPTCPTLEATHRNFDTAVTTCIEHLDHSALVVATHNQNSVLHTLKLMAERDVPLAGGRVEFAQLLGMSDLLTFNLAAMGAEGYKYIPYGPREKAIPYLVRRAQENSAATDDSTRERDTIWREVWRRLLG